MGERTRSLPGAAGGTGGGGGGGGGRLAEPDLSHSLSSQRRVGGARQLNLNSNRAPECQQILEYQLISTETKFHLGCSLVGSNRSTRNKIVPIASLKGKDAIPYCY